MRWMKLEPIIQSEVSQKITNTVYECIYMEFRKMVTIILYARQQKRHRYIEQSRFDAGYRMLGAGAQG